MSQFTTFMVKDFTKDGYTMAIAGICPFAVTRSMQDEIKNLMNNYTFPKTDDVFEVDYFMANYFSCNAPEYILAWGITIHVPESSGPTGGIIGNPHRDINSADSNSEYIGNGLSVAAHPGGPGIVIVGDPLTAKEVLDYSKPAQGGRLSLISMAEKALAFNIPAAIMITDGTGYDAVGCAMTIEKDIIKYTCLK